MKPETDSPKCAPVDFASLGLRPITRWVPNILDPAFLERYRQQREVLAASMTPGRESDIEFWESVQTHEGWV